MRIAILLLAAGFCLATGVARADEAGDVAAEEIAGTFSLDIENDMFGGSDGHYTNGVRASWLYPPRDGLPAWARFISRSWPLLDPDGDIRLGYSLGQNMYTPDNISERGLIRNDRPYAGWLYAGFMLTSATDSRLDSLELDVGVIGPLSLAGPTQRTWHGWFGLEDPQGWSNQLRNEPGVVLIYERKWRHSLGELWDMEFQALPHAGGSLGNVFTDLGAGIELRVGPDLPDDFGASQIRPSLPGSAFFRPAGLFGWYLFGGVGGRYVARNIFLDGNSFRSSHRVDREPLVADLRFGAALAFQHFRITYTQVFRSREFAEQDQGDRFGAVALSFRF